MLTGNFPEKDIVSNRKTCQFTANLKRKIIYGEFFSRTTKMRQVQLEIYAPWKK